MTVLPGITAIQQQPVPLTAERGGGLVHQAAGDAGEGVLGGLAELGEGERGQ